MIQHLPSKAGAAGLVRAALLSLAVASSAAGAALGVAAPAHAEAPGVVNVNTATPDELARLPGIGDAKARAIVDHRKQHGAFREVEDLLEVKGIGDAALERIRSRVVLEGKTTLRE